MWRPPGRVTACSSATCSLRLLLLGQVWTERGCDREGVEAHHI